MFNKTKDGQPLDGSPRSAPVSKSSGSKPSRPASLGPSISLSGNLTGSEDLIIEGSVEGEVTMRDHKVTISQTGTVKADVYGKSICVEGKVDGNLMGDEQVVIRQSGRVRGNVTAPKVNLENGAKFKGSIDMQPGPKAGARDDSKSPAAKSAEPKQPQASPGPSAARQPA